MTQPVVIIGGGPVGMSLALALHKQGVAAEIHDLRPRGAAAGDQRILALSHGSQQILANLGVWSAIKATPIFDIHVSQRGAAGRTRISAREEKVAALGYVASSSDIAMALDNALEAANISYIGESRLLDVTPADDTITIDLSDGSLHAQLVAYAEGRIGESVHVVERDYDQHALICRLTPAKPHRNVAWERFTQHGPFALLPFEGDYAAVYVCAPQDAERLKGMPDAALLAHLQNQFGPRVQFTAVSGRFIYPLGLRYREHPTAPRQVWLGNAAQTLHPVAGQGFNLALRDCMALAHCVAVATDPGAAEVLTRYAANRRLDRRGTIGITDGLIRLFSNDNPILKHARGAGLIALDLVPPLRSFLARRMMFGARAW
ncbi:MAG TPA: FAD-dependent monooxygenase [Rhodocyclaceae bacterium]|jgi:2-octaprenyl-6-methoxyphenol hydroxylase|nr:FAD-dependent monooxygenase [Rhodocyclaceae bacterium]